MQHYCNRVTDIASSPPRSLKHTYSACTFIHNFGTLLQYSVSFSVEWQEWYVWWHMSIHSHFYNYNMSSTYYNVYHYHQYGDYCHRYMWHRAALTLFKLAHPLRDIQWLVWIRLVVVHTWLYYFKYHACSVPTCALCVYMYICKEVAN